ncbi:hypothetical protein SKAU_G00106920 [Synaphobranchus kaupii]|uniref:Uncharacterized protein n=1 Tax=Synaphobranchus kaupii TaxID=118154 RepID=A0A9Q1G0C4_SYNKA|nr:hypothetical protein SKAU_G00106920 [Synaphobranchus kaupii]
MTALILTIQTDACWETRVNFGTLWRERAKIKRDNKIMELISGSRRERSRSPVPLLLPHGCVTVGPGLPPLTDKDVRLHPAVQALRAGTICAQHPPGTSPYSPAAGPFAPVKSLIERNKRSVQQ